MSHAETHHHHHDNNVPLPALIAIGALLATVLVFVTISQATGLGQQVAPPLDVKEAHLINFTDEEDGGVAVWNAAGEQVHLYPSETGGFVRTAMRALTLHRQTLGIGKEPPFRLVETYNRRLIIEDPATGRHVALESFGDDNTAQFALIMDKLGEDE